MNETARATTTVVVVDDHVTVADLLSRALDAEPDLDCLGTAHTVAEGEALIVALRPDAVVLDARLGAEDGLELAARLTRDHPDLRIVILTAYADGDMAAAAAQAGVGCLLSKGGTLDRLLQCLRNPRRPGLVIDPDLFVELSRPTAEAAPAPRLTPRELEVLHRLAEGMDTRAIAKTLNISVNTCRGYVKSLLSRLGAHSQLQAVAVANRHGLLRASAAPVAVPHQRNGDSSRVARVNGWDPGARSDKR